MGSLRVVLVMKMLCHRVALVVAVVLVPLHLARAETIYASYR